MGTLISTALTVAVSLAASAVVFVGADRAVSNIKQRWRTFLALPAALIGLICGAVLQHNDWLPAGPGLGGPLKPGWIVIVAGGIVGALIAAALGEVVRPQPQRLDRWERALRPVVFVGPALVFVIGGLVIPGLRTMWLSIKNGPRGREAGVTLDHYWDIFTDDEYFSIENWQSFFTSRLFITGLAVALIAAGAAWASATRIAGTQRGIAAARVLSRLSAALGLAVAAAVLAGFVEALAREPNRSAVFDVLTVLVSSRVSLAVVLLAVAGACAWWVTARRRRGDVELDWGAPTSSTMLVLAVVMLIFGALSTLRGVVWNNIWWVVTVAGISTVLGLLLAVLAERARGERLAKTLIFMPMAISMVGAAVIWDFMYEVQATGNQTGLFNAVLQGLGFSSRGFFINSSMIPWNNFWIMFIMVWIQTGFAMVVLSAAIRAVPDEYTEAARVDGATEAQAFWRVVVPQIRPTIIVVVTTLMVIVTKVFDLVKATTNGANRTNVLANEMFDQLRDRNFTSSSAFAVVLLALVLPVMIYNIRRLQKDLA